MLEKESMKCSVQNVVRMCETETTFVTTVALLSRFLEASFNSPRPYHLFHYHPQYHLHQKHPLFPHSRNLRTPTRIRYNNSNYIFEN